MRLKQRRRGNGPVAEGKYSVTWIIRALIPKELWGDSTKTLRARRACYRERKNEIFSSGSRLLLAKLRLSLGLWRTLHETSTLYSCPRPYSSPDGRRAKSERDGQSQNKCRGGHRKLDNERIQAQIHADATALDRIYAADFIGVGPSGTGEPSCSD